MGIACWAGGKIGKLSRDSLSHWDGTGAGGEHFYGDPAILTDNPVLMNIALPVGNWQLAARPRGGWPAQAATTWQLRVTVLLAGAFILFPTILAGRLSAARRR